MGNVQRKHGQFSENLLQKEEDDESVKEGRSTFTCEICIEPMSSGHKFKNNGKCVHPFCMDCLAKHIEAKLEDKVATIKCPGLNCKQLLDPFTCQLVIPTELFNEWSDCLFESHLLSLEGCYCPYQNCSELVINECGGVVKKSKCPYCERFFCYKCKVQWHAGYWCKETRERKDANDLRFGELVEKLNWTRCPYCGQAIERLIGCNTVKCRCGKEFCHKCGGILHGGPCELSEAQRNCVGLPYALSLLAIILLYVFLAIYARTR